MGAKPAHVSEPPLLIAAARPPSDQYPHPGSIGPPPYDVCWCIHHTLQDVNQNNRCCTAGCRSGFDVISWPRDRSQARAVLILRVQFQVRFRSQDSLGMSKTIPRKKTLRDSGRNGRGLPTALQSRFAEARSRLGPNRQQLIRDILDNCEETCFLSSRELAKRYDVDAATVVRTVQAMGYKGFADFSDDLRRHFVTRITPYTVLKAATQEKRSVADHIEHSLDKALENLNALRADLDPKRVIELAKLIHRSR